MNTLTELLDENEKDLTLIFEYLKDYNLLLPFKDDKLIYIQYDKNKDIQAFTQRNQISDDLKYDKLERAKLDKIIKEIYLKDSSFKEIRINPQTNDFVLNKTLIEIYLKYIEQTTK